MKSPATLIPLEDNPAAIIMDKLIFKKKDKGNEYLIFNHDAPDDAIGEIIFDNRIRSWTMAPFGEDVYFGPNCLREIARFMDNLYSSM